MEYVLILVVIIIGAFLYFGGKFANFKSQLMNELGKRGMDFQSADVLYSAMAHKIHKLHQDGVPVSVIADMLCDDNGKAGQHQTSTNEYNSFDGWLEVFKVECDKTKSGVTPFLDFMDISSLERAYQHGEDPKVLAHRFAKDFDPSNIS